MASLFLAFQEHLQEIEVNELLKDRALYESMRQAYNPYGDGKACRKIVNIIKG